MTRLLLACLVLMLAGCEGPQAPLNPAGPQAHSIARLTWVFFGICTTVFVVVVGALGWALMRRRRPEDDQPETDRYLSRVVTGAIVTTVIILAGLAAASVALLSDVRRPPAATAFTIEAIGHQWWWEFQYRGGTPQDHINSPNELHLPVGTPVTIRALSRDVIHSFWVPNLQGKHDLIPGRINEFWIQADVPGIYRGQCAEFCGHQHAQMAFLVVAEPMEAFQQWVASQRQSAPSPTTALEQRGHEVFTTGPCALCHTIRGTTAGSRVGPDLTHVASRQTIAAGTLPNTRGHRAGWIADSQSIKPGNRMPPQLLSPDDLQAVLAYLETLR